MKSRSRRSSASPFKTAPFLRSLDGNPGLGAVMFDTEADAKAGLESMRANRSFEAPPIESTTIYELIVEVEREGALGRRGTRKRRGAVAQRPTDLYPASEHNHSGCAGCPTPKRAKPYCFGRYPARSEIYPQMGPGVPRRTSGLALSDFAPACRDNRPGRRTP